ncbi:MAG: anti-sigma factor [Chloroflexota bacterium]|nr:anti-sigma factor [Chloroflexota bacterium]
MNHDNDMVGAYVLDALSLEEREQFETHLAGCAECQAEVAELRQVVDVLPLALEPAEPPLILRDRIMQEAGEGFQPQAALRVVPGMKSAPRGRLIVSLLATAAAVVIAALGAWNLALRTNGNGAQQQFVAAMARGNPVVTVQRTGAAPGASASLVRATKSAYLVVSGLPPSASSKVYQVWYMHGTTPHSAGTFRYSSGTKVVALPGSSGYNLAAVTIEPGPRGSPSPTGPKVLLGKLSA